MTELVPLAGRRAVMEALRSGRRKLEKLYVLAQGGGTLFRTIRELAVGKGIKVVEASGRELDELAGGRKHQGVLALAEPGSEVSLEDLIERVKASGTPALLVALDELKDPQNVGAILRSAEGAGAHGALITLHRSVSSGPGMERSSAGAVEYIPLARVVNLRNALLKLKDAGCWVVGADAGAEQECFGADLVKPLVLVLGEEGRGLRELTKRTCDELVRIPLAGRIQSLNVSASAAVILFEAVRQRRLAAGGGSSLKSS